MIIPIMVAIALLLALILGLMMRADLRSGRATWGPSQYEDDEE